MNIVDCVEIDNKILTNNASKIEDEDEIPYLTIKSGITWYESDYDVKLQKILPLSIEAILSSEVVNILQHIYKFNNIEYKNVQITGKIINILHIDMNKTMLKVNDETGEIFCFADFSLDNPKQLNHVARSLALIKIEKQINNKELQYYTSMNDYELISNIDDYVEGLYLNKVTNLFMKKLHKTLKVTNAQLKVGDLITVTGNVKDGNNKVIFIWHLIRENNHENDSLLYHK